MNRPRTNALLDKSYAELGLTDGRLLNAVESARELGDDAASWTATGEWLSLAARMGADKVFFVEDDPVLIFAALPADATPRDWLAAYRNAWCLSGPQCLFLAAPNELRVYALSAPPVASVDEWHTIEPLEVVRRAGAVGTALARFARAQVESGEAFAGSAFASRDKRADRQLLADVRNATEQLTEEGLAPDVAHALIERALLVRYLEHRGVLTEDYFGQIAAASETWRRVLAAAPEAPIVNRRAVGLDAVLRNRAFTFTLFNRLATDFNGDLFVVSADERRQVEQRHLDLLRGMLLGHTDPQRPPLFLWAYDFSIVPIALISSMYEQFYRAASDAKDTSTHYTPPELVQYIVNEVLTPDVLTTSPRVLDPACGSGIFLAEAYRAIVRFESVRRGRRLRADELRHLLLTRIAGVDLNPAAVRLAAFSLYLALLNYQRPQDIQRAGPLPRLIADGTPGEQGVLVVADAFDPAVGETDTQENAEPRIPWRTASFDVVIGNPPWSEPRGKGLLRQDRWVSANALPVGDRSPSQAFLWRSLTFLRADGIAALLVAGGVLANARSVSFRRAFLSSVTVAQVVNFTEGRALFFVDASAPFLLLHVRATPPQDTTWFPYLTLRRTKALANTGAVRMGRMDRRLVRQADVASRDYLWKTYAWGSHHDAALMAQLELETTLGELLAKADVKPALGWQRGNAEPPSFISALPQLDVTRMTWWGALDEAWLLPPPAHVGRPTNESLYRGQRLIITRRAYAHFGPYARLEDRDFTFRHTAYGIPLQHLSAWQAKVILATLLSSLGRYCLFLRAGRWSAWHDEVTQAEILATPIRLTSRDEPATRRVLAAVDRLRQVKQSAAVFAESARDMAQGLLGEVDEALYDLFELSQEQRDVITDLHASRADLSEHWQSHGGLATRVQLPDTLSGTVADIARAPTSYGNLSAYLHRVLSAWNRELAPDGELTFEVHRSHSPPILCVVFTTATRGTPSAMRSPNGDWTDALRALESVVHRPVGHDLFINGVLRAVTDTQIIVAKRDERRLWTATAAREDVEATMLRLIAGDRR